MFLGVIPRPAFLNQWFPSALIENNSLTNTLQQLQFSFGIHKILAAFSALCLAPR